MSESLFLGISPQRRRELRDQRQERPSIELVSCGPPCDDCGDNSIACGCYLKEVQRDGS